VCAGEGSRRASNGGLSDRSPEAMLARARELESPYTDQLKLSGLQFTLCSRLIG